MRNVYVVRLAKPVKIDATAPHFGSREVSSVYVVASSFRMAEDAVGKKYPHAEVRGIELLNYAGLPIVLGD